MHLPTQARDATGHRKYRPVIILCLVLAATYAMLAAWAVLWLSPRVPYADTWHFDAQLLTHAFPHGVLMVDNGHAQLPSRLLRWLELTLWHGNLWPTILAGLAFLVTALLLWVTLPHERSAAHHRGARDSGYRLAFTGWVLTGVVGLCWLGSARTLAHGNEAIHSYLVITCLFGAVRLASLPGRRRLGAALLLALLATFTFGTGAAVFAAVLVTVVLRRGDWRGIAATLVAATVAGSLYLLLPHGASGTRVLDIQPWLQLQQMARWLASPWLLAGGPLVDASLLSHLPPALRLLATPFAQLSTSWFGPARTAVWPELGLGLLGLVWLLWLTWLARFRPLSRPRCELLALATAWFATVCAALVVLARSDYFLQFPSQIYASRYAVWYTLFWCGLLGATLWRLHAWGRSRTALFVPLALALLLLPSSVWTGMRAAHMSRIAATDALGVRFGIIARHGGHGENWIDVMARARPLLRQARVAMFAPGAGPLAGTTLDPDTAVTALHDVRWQPLDNALPGPAAHVQFRFHVGDVSRLLLLDRERRIIGVAHPTGEDSRWRGRVHGARQPLLVTVP